MMRRLLIGVILLLLSEYYSFVAIRGLLRHTSPRGRAIGMGIYLGITVLLWVFLFTFRRIPWHDLPPILSTLAISFAIGFFLAKIVVALVMLLGDLRRVLLWVVGYFRNKPRLHSDGTLMPRSEFVQNVALGAGASIIGLFLWGTTNRYRYRVHRAKLRASHIPEAFHGFKIVQLSDIHSGSFDNPEAVAAGVERALAEKPDVIFFTGDLVNNEATEIVPYKSIFARLKAPLGVYSTLGNHDYGDYVEWPSPAAKMQNLDTLKQHHADMGWKLMLNEHVYLQKGDSTIGLIGIENWGAKAGFPKYGDMRAATAGYDLTKAPFTILLSHDPSHWEAQVRPEYPFVDLTLSGHTHGMQFGIEIPGFKWSPVQYVYQQWAGLYQAARQHLYVNRGFGFLGYPGRVGILPEITVITLEKV
jgi:predicted MPP superfamily phosphohydrolase